MPWFQWDKRPLSRRKSSAQSLGRRRIAKDCFKRKEMDAFVGEKAQARRNFGGRELHKNATQINMKTNMSTLILILAALTAALTAGLFFAWATSVVPGLGKLDDAGYLSAMQSINREIQNPLFFSCFIGAALLLPIAAFLSYSSPPGTRFWLLVAASVVYIIGVFGVTIAGNVPLNDMLDALDLKAADAFQLAAARETFEAKWNGLNLVRTWMAVVALVLVLFALMRGD
jgi:uncharacterized membrane protein